MLIRKIGDFDELEELGGGNFKQGLFQTVWCQRVFAKHFCLKEKIIILGWFDEERLVGYGSFEIREDKILFLGMKPVLGKEEVTDYGDIVVVKPEMTAEVWQTGLGWFKNKGFSELQLDYVREDSKTFEFFKEREEGKIEKQEVSPFIDLPGSFEEYLAGFRQKRRKELKRKIKRLETEEGFSFCSKETVGNDFEEFIRLVRLSGLEKRKFMSEKIKEYFKDLMSQQKRDWQVHLCFLKMKERVVAGLMTFENSEEVWLYNSGFDPEYRYYSVGLVLKAFRLKKAIEQGKKKYDFLRGGERYKYDLGAKDLGLYKINLGL